jgi:hypothetical protein
MFLQRTSTFFVSRSRWHHLKIIVIHPSIINWTPTFRSNFSLPPPLDAHLSLMCMLSSIGSVIRLTKKLCVLACTCSAATIPVHQCIVSSQPSPPFHPRERHPSIPHVVGSFFPLKTPHFVAPSESFSEAWMSGIERWKTCYEFLRDKRAYQDPKGTNVCPGGDNIVAELGSEMAKNGNIVSDSDSSSRTYRSQLDRLPS